jgi:exonuclease VII large subunit
LVLARVGYGTRTTTPTKEDAMSNHTADVASAAATAGSEVATTAADEVRQVVEQAKEQTSRVASEATAQARSALDQAAADVKQQANAQTDRIAEALRTFAGQVQALVDGRQDEAGRLPDMARQATDQLQSIAGRIGDGGIDGVLAETQRFARRRPGLFLAGAAAAGFLSGRLLRGAKAAGQQPNQPQQARSMPITPPAPQPLDAATTDGTDVIVLQDDRPDTVLSGMRSDVR